MRHLGLLVVLDKLGQECKQSVFLWTKALFLDALGHQAVDLGRQAF